MKFIVTSEYAKMRLDKFLKEHFPDFSRAYLQKMIKSGMVKVNGRAQSVHHFLKEGDEVEAVVKEPEELRVIANPAVKIIKMKQSDDADKKDEKINDANRYDRNDLRHCPIGARGALSGHTTYTISTICVIHEETDFIVINKPVGLVVHQSEAHKTPDTLVNGLLSRYPDIGKVGDDPLRPGIVHRLDGDVSGVMVVALTQDMFDHLKKQFKLHEVEKEYVALVEGKVTPPSGTIEFALARKGMRMVARPKSSLSHPPLIPPSGRGGNLLRRGEKDWGKMAITDYEVIEGPKGDKVSQRVANVTWLKIITRTGRTHQIRVHLKAIGHPIIGDRLYMRALKHKSIKALRLMLHARKLVFRDLKGEWRVFVIDLPQEFKTNP